MQVNKSNAQIQNQMKAAKVKMANGYTVDKVIDKFRINRKHQKRLLVLTGLMVVIYPY